MSLVKIHFSVKKATVSLYPLFYQHAGKALLDGLSGIDLLSNTKFDLQVQR
jgi:hypothetical protein